MIPQRHVILRQVIELTVRSEAEGRRAHDLAVHAWENRLLPVLERECAALGGSDSWQRVDRVEVDLGCLPLQEFADRFGERFSRELGPALRRALQAAGSQSGEGRRERLAAHFELLSHFVRTGALPWWADGSDPTLIVETLRSLAQAAPRQLAAWTQTVVERPEALCRLVRAAADADLAALLTVFQPSAGPFRGLSPEGPATAWAGGHDEAQTGPGPKAAYAPGPFGLAAEDESGWQGVFECLVSACVQWVGSAAPGTGLRPAPVREQIWRSAVGIAASPGAAAPSAWVQEVLRQLCATLRISEAELAGALARQPDLAATPAGRQLVPLLEALANETREAATLTRERDRGGGLATGTEGATLPGAAASSAEAPTPAAPERLPGEPVTSPGAVTSGSPAVPAGSRHDVRAHGEPGTVRSPHRSGSPGSGPPPRTAPPALRENAWPESALSHTDAFYVDNAGLVLLWPFIEHFLAHLGMVVEQQFKSEAARQRAVGVLQHLVTGDLTPPEHHLPLSKVLCGLEVEALFEFGDPVTEEEQREGDRLLIAVVEQAPILKQMSPAGFRRTFLRRAGQLSRREGVWLLRVERETYDLVLDRFPWSCRWVRLPWMAGPLQVEW